MKTKIIAEDSRILVCFKPAGLAVQSGRIGEPDMVSELKNYLAAKMTAGGGSPYLGVIHRLDQPVSGLLVFAKTPKAAAQLSSQASSPDGGEKGMEKEYCALCYTGDRPEGMLSEGECTLVDYLLRDGKGNISRVVSKTTPGAKRAELVMEPAGPAGAAGSPEKGEKIAAVRIRLRTGRHHQIRVQLAHAQLPLLGDARYGSEGSRACSQRLGIRNICLCACGLSFIHPETGKRVQYRLEELPWKV